MAGITKGMKKKRAEDVFLNEIESGNIQVDDDGCFWKTVDGERKRIECRVPNGYLQLRKKENGILYCAMAHRVVWEHFNRRTIRRRHIINHINGKKDDNRPGNLEMITISDNLKHAHEHGLVNQFGEKNPNAKLTDRDVVEIRLLYSSGGYTQNEVAQMYGVSHQTISKIVRGDRRQKQLGKTADYSERRFSNARRDSSNGRFVSKQKAG